MAPTGLDYTHLRISEVRDGPAQEVSGRDEVRVEDSYKLTARLSESGRQCSSLKASSVSSPEVCNGYSLVPKLRRGFGQNLGRLISGIVQELDLEPIGWIV